MEDLYGLWQTRGGTLRILHYIPGWTEADRCGAPEGAELIRGGMTREEAVAYAKIAQCSTVVWERKGDAKV